VWKRIGRSPALKTGLYIAGALVLALAAWLLRRRLLAIFTPFAVALAIAYVLNPVVLWLQQRRLPRTLAVAAIYLAFFGLVFALSARLVPLVVREADRLAEGIPQYTQQAQQLLNTFYSAARRLNLPLSVQKALEAGLRDAEASLVARLSRIPEMTVDVARGIFNLVLVLILTFYFLKDFEMVKDSLYLVIPRKNRARARKILHEIDTSLGRYVRGQLLVSLLVAAATYLSLLLLGVDFALILALVAGVTNVIPYFGPFLGAIPAVLTALLQAPALALKTALVYTIIQQAESHFIAPQVLGKSLGLHPLVVILALLAGGQFLGLPGLMVAVPATAVARIVIRNLVVPPVDGR